VVYSTDMNLLPVWFGLPEILMVSFIFILLVAGKEVPRLAQQLRDRIDDFNRFR